MKTLKNLFEKNKKWAVKLKETDPDFFSNLSQQQKP